MTVSSLVFFAAILLNFAFPANGLVYRTNDAIIIEDSNSYQPMNPFLMVKDVTNLYGAIPVHPVTGLMYGPPSVYPWLIHNNKSQPTDRNGKPTDSNQKTKACGALPQTGASFGEPGVVGGVAEKNAWPGIVMLKFGIDASYLKFFCVGSLISPNKVLTSADCIDMVYLPLVTVYLGLRTLKASDAKETRTVLYGTIHEGFNRNTKANNIAILTLSSPVRFTSAISPVCLAPEVLVFAQFDGGVAVGWGLSKEKDPKSNDMHQTPMKILYNNKCINIYGNNAKSMMCAAGSAADICHRDSGGPLFVRFSPEYPWTQIGIVNFGDGCSGPNYLGVFTRIMLYRSWIKEHAFV